MEAESLDAVGQATVEWTVAAMNAAADRMRDVHWHDPGRAFATIGETLWWVCILDEVLGKRYGDRYFSMLDADEHVKPLLAGMRHARNRFAHGDEVVDFVEVSALVGSNWSGGYTAGWRWCVLPPVSVRRKVTVPAGKIAAGRSTW